jgi:hypothetical protein
MTETPVRRDPITGAPATGPAARWRAARAPLAVGLVVIVVGITIGVLSGRPAGGLLDPDGVNETGSRALAQLLRAEGVALTVARTSSEVAATGADTTVLVTFPDQLGDAQLHTVRRSAADLVLVAPDQPQLTVLAPAVRISSLHEAVTDREPGCELPAARAAGKVELGNRMYRSDAGTSCYRDDNGAGLVQLADGARTVTVLGSAELFTNGELASEANAALALRLLGGKPKLLWYLPAPEATPAGQPRRTPGELIPRGWIWGTAQLAVAAVIAALWRARRLGAVVREPLPVVVRAVEVTEGRARLYRRAAAREHAAEALRAATRGRLASLLGFASAGTGPGGTAGTGPGDEAALVDAVAARTGRSGAEVRALLYRPGPSDDLAMVELADQLDSCEQGVRRT